MAGLGDFVSGFAHSVQQLPALIQHQQQLGLARQKLEQQVIKQEINDAQENFFKGVALLKDVTPDAAPGVIRTFLMPAVETLSRHGVVRYTPQETAEFFSKLEANPNYASVIAKDLQAAEKAYRDKDGKLTDLFGYLRATDSIIASHAARMTSDMRKGIEGLQSRAASEAYPYLTGDEEKKIAASRMTKEGQTAYGIGQEKKNENLESLINAREERLRLQQERLDLQREREGRLAEGQGKKESDADEKKREKAYADKIRAVESYLRRTRNDRAKVVAAMEKDPGSRWAKTEAPKLLEEYDKQLAIAEDSLAMLQNREVEPEGIAFPTKKQPAAPQNAEAQPQAQQGAYRGKVGKKKEDKYEIGQVLYGHVYIGNNQWVPVKK